MNFSDIHLDPRLAKDIESLNFSQCTPIQESTIPLVLEGKDVAGLAQTGTGKTGAFLIPLIERILRSEPLPETATPEQIEIQKKRAFPDWRAQNYILVLVPTRELAEQVHENAQKFSLSSGLRSFPIYGGTSYDKQKEALILGLQFVVATPGRLIDLYKEHLVDLKNVRAVVFDEADRMFDMGFKDDMKYLLQRIPKDRQFLVFSATLNFDVLNTAYQFGSEPVEVNISKDKATADNVKDQIFHVGQDEKPQHLLSLIKLHNPKQTIIFTNFKHNVERVAQFLNINQVPAMAISSLLSQGQRNKVLEQFKEDNHLNILVATDVAARGLDIQGVDLVVNYDLPGDCESYVHRIGRTGRAGSEGTAFSLVSDKDVEALSRIEDYLKRKLEVGFLEDQVLIKDYKPMVYSDSSSGSYSSGSSGSRSSGSRSAGSYRGDRSKSGGRSGGGDRYQGSGRSGGGSGGGHRSHQGGSNRYDSAPGSEGRKSRSFDKKRSDSSSGKSESSWGRKDHHKDQYKDSHKHHSKQSGQETGSVPGQSGQDSRKFHKSSHHKGRPHSGSGSTGSESRYGKHQKHSYSSKRPSSSTTSQASAGVTQKVVSFFKKLFS